MGIMDPSHQSDHPDRNSNSHSRFTPLHSNRSFSSLPSLSRKNFQNHSTTSHQSITTLRGHTSYISSLTIAGELLYSGSSDNEIRSWTRIPVDPNHETDNGPTNDNVVAVGKGAVKSIVAISDRLFSAHQDNKIRVWKISTNHQEKYTHVATLPTLGDRALRLMAPSSRVQVRRHKTSTWVHHNDAISALALSEDESLLYSVSWDRTIKVWRVPGFRCLESIRNAHDDAINALALSKDGRIFTGSADKKIKVWRKAPEEKKHCLEATLEKHTSGINALVLSTDGSVLYSGASDSSVVVWKDDGGGNMEALGVLRGHSSSILCLAVVEDLVCSGSADKTIRIWRKIGGCYVCLALLEGHGGPVKCLAADIDHHDPSNISSTSSSSTCLIYSGGLDCEIKVWHISIPNA